MNHVTALLLDAVNIIGGFLLGAALLTDLPRVGSVLGRVAAALSRFSLVAGILALVVAGYYLIMHLVSGPHVFHFELVGIGVGVALLRDRLFPRTAGDGARAPGATVPLSGPAGPMPYGGGPAPYAGGPAAYAAGPAPDAGGQLFYDPRTAPAAAPAPGTADGVLSGGALLLAVFGLIAILVGIQGLFTPDA